MRTITLFIVLTFLSGFIYAQERDLNYFLEQAKLNSPLLNKNKNDSKLIQLELLQVKNMLTKPMVNIEANVLFAPIVSHDNGVNRFEWVSDGADNYKGYDLALTDGGQYLGVVSINQPLFTKPTYQSYSDKADISNQIIENNTALTIHEIEQLVSYQYILCLKSEMQSHISSALLEELKSQLVMMRKMVLNAIYKQTDLLLLQIEYQNFEVEYKTLLAEYRTNLFDLNLLCGINDTNLVAVEDINFQLKSETIAQSRFLDSYKLDSLNNVAGLSIYEQKYKPQVNIFANAGLNAVYQPAFNRLGFSTGIALSWNIYDGHQRKTQREITTLHLQKNEFDKKYLLTQADINKNKILNQIKSLDQRITLFEDQINQYDNLLNVYNQELLQGELSVMDFKNLLKDIAAKKQESLLLKMEKQLLINSYNYWNY